MAIQKPGLLNQDPYASPNNTSGTQRQQQTPAANPYQGGLTNDFSGYSSGPPPDTTGLDMSSLAGRQAYNDQANAARAKGYSKRMSDISSGDPDVIQAAYNSWKLQNHGPGDDGAEEGALLNMYKGRIAEKNSLAEQISGSDDQLAKSQDINRSTAGSALDQGLKNTRSNFNGRGLLYSGMRQGGEQSVKNSVASQLASSMTGTARDAANSKTAAENAYASVDLANQQDTLNRANQAFDTASANNIARLQAMQQLGSGIGAAAGTIAGQAYTPNQPVQPDGSAGGYGSFYNGSGLIGSSSAGNGPAYNQTRAQPSWE